MPKTNAPLGRDVGIVETIVRPITRKGGKTINIAKKYSTLSTLKITYVPIDDLYPNAYNPNRQSDREFELLLKSMEEDGFTTPIVAQAKSKMIVDGEHRWRAAQRLGYKELPVVLVDMSDPQMKIATLRHNRARGSEDIELTIKVLQDLRTLGALDHAVDSLNMTEVELNTLIDDLPGPELMAGDTFNQAWLPSDAQATQTAIYKPTSETHVAEKTKRLREEVGAQMEGASSLMEIGDRSKKRGVDFLTVTVIVSGDKAAFVREALGDQPAETLLKMACLEIASNEELIKEITERKNINEYNNWFRDTFREVLGYVPDALTQAA